MQKTIQGCGMGLRFQHIDQVIEEQPNIAWLEVLIDNYLQPHSVQQDYLNEVAQYYPLVFHGVGMSLGSIDPLNKEYLQRIKTLADTLQPAWISDHLCWTAVHGMVTHDLIPLPYTDETIQHVASRIRQVQDLLQRQLVIENVSSYLQYQQSSMSEWAFLLAVAEEADCQILLDINNIYVSAHNHGFHAQDYLQAIPAARVQQMHLAGAEDRGTHLLDTHGEPVSDAVWDLYRLALQRFGAVPTLVEWDNKLPSLARLLQEVAKAQAIMNEVYP